MIGYFENRLSTSYKSFEKMATALKDECLVLAGFGDDFRHARQEGRDAVVVRKAGSDEEISHPNLDLMNTQKLTDWAQRTCVPLVSDWDEPAGGGGSGIVSIAAPPPRPNVVSLESSPPSSHTLSSL